MTTVIYLILQEKATDGISGENVSHRIQDNKTFIRMEEEGEGSIGKISGIRQTNQTDVTDDIVLIFRLDRGKGNVTDSKSGVEVGLKEEEVSQIVSCSIVHFMTLDIYILV